MPELPEVETTVRKLKPLLKGKRILGVNKKILGVERKGKAVLLRLSSGKILAFHMRMSGKLLLVNRDFQDKYIRRRFKLSDGKDLVLHDVRRFGVVWYGPEKEVSSDKYFRTLGPDALTVTPQNIKNLLAARNIKIKSFLLNQKNIAGIGNIMADEILWHAKINPERKISSLSDGEIKKLWGSMRTVLQKSIRLGGSSMRDWLQPDALKGGYFKKRLVYGREGEPCFRCGNNKIIKCRVAGRSTYFCKICQKK